MFSSWNVDNSSYLRIVKIKWNNKCDTFNHKTLHKCCHFHSNNLLEYITLHKFSSFFLECLSLPSFHFLPPPFLASLCPLFWNLYCVFNHMFFIPSTSLDCEFPEGSDYVLFLSYPQPLTCCLAHSRYIIKEFIKCISSE